MARVPPPVCPRLPLALLLALLALGACGGPVIAGPPSALVAVRGDLVIVGGARRSSSRQAEAAWIAAVHDAIHGQRAIDLVRGGLRVATTAGGVPRQVWLEITVEPDGRIEEVALLERSAIDEVDDRARAIFTGLGALPPPPPALYSEDGLTHLQWRLGHDQRGCGEDEARVPRRLDRAEAGLARLVRSGRHAEAAGWAVAAIDRGAAPVTLARRLAREILAAAVETGRGRDTVAAAAFALARAGDARAVPALRRMLRTPSPQAACAAGLLAHLQARVAVADLEAALRRNHPATNVAAALALAALGNPEGATLLLPALRAGTPTARLDALRALAAVPSTTQAGGVAALLADAHPQVRHEAARVLGLIGGAAATQSLVRHAGHPDARDRAAALRALGAARAQGPAARWAVAASLTDASLEVRAAGTAALVLVAPAAALDEVQRGLATMAPEVLLATAVALGELGSPAARQALEQIGRVRAEARVRDAAADALARLAAARRRPLPATGDRPAAAAAAPERRAEHHGARAAILELATASGARRLDLAARQLPLRHACATPQLDSPAAPPVECAARDRGAPAGARAAGRAPAAVTVATLD